MSKFETYSKETSRKSSTSDFITAFGLSHLKQITLAFSDTSTHVIFHALDTWKVRLQAKSKFTDTSQFTLNKVDRKGN